ncbi:MAG: restriction endonuclease subunit S [Gammaproteobacteria bacterium]|nr:restriction endonuclease subunit S [Gammaproteobacteria bacterium]
MIAGFKQYPAMKDSGVEWLGDVPAHWDVRRLGQIGTLLKGRGGSKEDEVDDGIPCVRYGDLYTTHTWAITETRSRLAPTRAGEYTSIRFGDVLFAASGETTDEIGKSAVNLIRSRACCGGDIILFRARLQLDPRFMGYAADCRASAAQKASMGRGFTVVHIYPHQIKRVALAIPPLPEQSTIARFLDNATELIGRYIRTKEKLIELLGEYKQVLVHDAVTGRIDVRTGKPYPAYKPSGVQWLGDVPAHWDVRRLCTLVNISTGGRDTVDAREYGKYPFFVRSQTVERIQTWTFDGEAVLTAGDGVGVGRVFHHVDGRFDFHQRVYKFSDFRGILGRVFYHSIRALLRFQVMQGTAKSTVDSLRLPRLRSFPIPVPPNSEQPSLGDYIDKRGSEIDQTVFGIRNQVARLREYRMRLISDVVTGKLDVQNVTAQLSAIPRSEGRCPLLGSLPTQQEDD